MQIHELNTFTGTVGENTYLALDSGTDTSKISAQDLLAPLNERINNIIAGGDAPSEAEIVDARLGADGVAYPSLGDAIRDQVSYLKSDVETNYAKIDGYYDELTAGSAEQLISSQFVEDTEPYKFRTTGGSADVGNREEVDAIVGGTVCWNQLAVNGNFSSATGWGARQATVAINNGIAMVTPSSNGTQRGLVGSNTINYIAGHKFFITATVKSPITSTVQLSLSSGSAKSISVTADTWVKASCIWTHTSNYPSGQPYLLIAGTTTTSQTIQYKNVMYIDLTQMLGATIADYLYSLEATTAGAGVSKLKSWGFFASSYYDYNAGELKHVSGLASHDMTGFNQWDEEWEVGAISLTTGENTSSSTAIRSKNYIRVVSNTTYSLTLGSGTMAVAAYDAEKNFVANLGGYTGGRTVTIPENCAYIRFYVYNGYGTTYNNDICINLAWSGWRSGEYEPYQKHSYPLDSSLTLRGIPKLSADNTMYYDGDTYESDGTVTRKYGIVDLGTLTWLLNAANEFTANIPNSKGAVYAGVANAVCEKYLLDTYNHVHGHTTDKTIAVLSTNSYIYVYDTAYSDAASFKSAMSGVYLVYELATPTTETAEPYNEIQICDDFGTEEFVSTGIVPVGHNTRYPANLRDKLQHLPDLADNDGYYMIGQTNKQMHLEHFRIPKAPTTDGTYVLKATVSGGTPTYTWVDPNTESEVTNG